MKVYNIKSALCIRAAKQIAGIISQSWFQDKWIIDLEYQNTTKCGGLIAIEAFLGDYNMLHFINFNI